MNIHHNSSSHICGCLVNYPISRPTLVFSGSVSLAQAALWLLGVWASVCWHITISTIHSYNMSMYRLFHVPLKGVKTLTASVLFAVEERQPPSVLCHEEKSKNSTKSKYAAGLYCMLSVRFHLLTHLHFHLLQVPCLHWADIIETDLLLARYVSLPNSIFMISHVSDFCQISTTQENVIVHF